VHNLIGGSLPCILNRNLYVRPCQWTDYPRHSLKFFSRNVGKGICYIRYDSTFYNHVSSQLAATVANHYCYSENQGERLQTSENAGPQSDLVCEAPSFICCMSAIFCAIGGFLIAVAGIAYFDDRRWLRSSFLGIGLALVLWGYMLPGLPQHTTLWRATWGRLPGCGCNNSHYRQTFQHKIKMFGARRLPLSGREMSKVGHHPSGSLAGRLGPRNLSLSAVDGSGLG
jgi:hypothetical protein